MECDSQSVMLLLVFVIYAPCDSLFGRAHVCYLFYM